MDTGFIFFFVFPITNKASLSILCIYILMSMFKNFFGIHEHGAGGVGGAGIALSRI